MSSLRNAQKSHQKQYKERGQLSSRSHLGLLEKHKDYVARARDFHKKEKQLKVLRKKASERNPDEFYFKMINQKTKDGVHTIVNEHKYTKEQLMLMKTQDLNYVNFKRGVEKKKIEKLQSHLHLTNGATNVKREHIIFVDSEKEARDLIQSKKNTVSQNGTSSSIRRKPVRKMDKSYRELKQRLQREKQLNQSRQAMELQKNLMGKGSKRKIKVGGSTVYKWKKQRLK